MGLTQPWTYVAAQLRADLDGVVLFAAKVNPSIQSAISTGPTATMPFTAHVEFFTDRQGPVLLTLAIVVRQEGHDLRATADFTNEEGFIMLSETVALPPVEDAKTTTLEISGLVRRLRSRAESSVEVRKILQGAIS